MSDPERTLHVYSPAAAADRTATLQLLALLRTGHVLIKN